VRSRRHRRVRRTERPRRAVRREDAGSIRLIAHDLLAQAEHGEASLVDRGRAGRSAARCARADLEAMERASTSEATVRAHRARLARDGLDFANAFAAEHLELIGPECRGARTQTCAGAGCVFVGWPGATAFGDYVAGSNHILPTGGSARFASGLRPAPLSAARWRSCASHQSLEALGAAGRADRRAEGFDAHAESMRARVPDFVENPSS
jgi:histidinol dehydrogenase